MSFWMALKSARILALLAIAAPASTVGQAEPSLCLGPDSLTAFRLPWADSLGTSSDSAYIEDRRQLQLPATISSQVFLVQDAETCARILRMVDSLWPSRAGRAYVYQIGSVYAVEDPGLVKSGAQWPGVYFFSASGQYLGVIQRLQSVRRPLYEGALPPNKHLQLTAAR